jgi:hypothetical protein
MAHPRGINFVKCIHTLLIAGGIKEGEMRRVKRIFIAAGPKLVSNEQKNGFASENNRGIGNQPGKVLACRPMTAAAGLGFPLAVAGVLCENTLATYEDQG